jgi:hypothetical protein
MDAELKDLTDHLVGHLQDLRDLYDQLLQTARNKQRTMRSGDMDGMESWTAREQFLAERIAEIEVQRKEYTQQIAQKMDFKQTPKVSVIAQQMQEPYRSRLLALAGAVRSNAEKVYQINQVNDAVTQEILGCFAQVQQKIASEHCDLGLYDFHGQKRITNHINLLDAVG